MGGCPGSSRPPSATRTWRGPSAIRERRELGDCHVDVLVPSEVVGDAQCQSRFADAAHAYKAHQPRLAERDLQVLQLLFAAHETSEPTWPVGERGY